MVWRAGESNFPGNPANGADVILPGLKRWLTKAEKIAKKAVQHGYAICPWRGILCTEVKNVTIFDIIAIGGGVLLIVAPEWTYNFGRKEKVEMPQNWPRISRIVGAVFVAIGIAFLVLNLTRGG